MHEHKCSLRKLADNNNTKLATEAISVFVRDFTASCEKETCLGIRLDSLWGLLSPTCLAIVSRCQGVRPPLPCPVLIPEKSGRGATRILIQMKVVFFLLMDGDSRWSVLS